MNDNFRSNLRLTTNILIVIGTFLIAYKLGSINDFYRRKADCAKVISAQKKKAEIKLVEKYDLNAWGDVLSISDAAESFCQFYVP